MDYNGKLLFLERFLGKSRYSSNTKEAEFFCCFCTHHKKKLSINLETDCWQDWVCGKSGRNLVYILKKVGTPNDIQTYLSKFKAKQVKFNKSALRFSEYRLSLPKEFIPIVECQNTFEGRRAYNYLTKVRKIDHEDILRHKIGIASTGDYRDRIIFPSFNKDGYVNHFAAKSPRYGGYMGPLNLPKGYEKTIILNDLNINWTKLVVITEGFIDMLKSVPNTIPLFGSSLPEDSLTFHRIIDSAVEVCLALDADAKKKTDRIAKRFTAWGASVYTMDVSLDLGNMLKHEAEARYNARTRWTGESSLREKLRNLC